MHSYNLSLVSAPAVLPVTLAELKRHTRIDHADDDALLTAYCQAAVSRLEGKDGILGRTLITQTWDLKLDRFPAGSAPIRPPLSPLQSVTSITYVDTAGDTQTWSSASYDVDSDSEPARISPGYEVAYPTARWTDNAVTVRFVAGYGSLESDVPEPIRLAIMIMVSHWYEIREPVITGTIISPVPMSVDSLVGPYRLNMIK